MDSINNPVGGQPHDPYEKYRVEAIERERHSKEELKEEPEPKPPKRSIIAAYALLIFRRFLDLFQAHPHKREIALAENDIRKNLLLLKIAFETMQIEDKSQDISFLNHLSKLWHQALEDGIEFKKSSIVGDKFRTLLRSVQQYPEKQEHTLGYYLTEYAGQKWIPFPYMELIQKIHAEHKKNPSLSPLSVWMSQLEEICTLLSRD